MDEWLLAYDQNRVELSGDLLHPLLQIFFELFVKVQDLYENTPFLEKELCGSNTLLYNRADCSYRDPERPEDLPITRTNCKLAVSIIPEVEKDVAVLSLSRADNDEGLASLYRLAVVLCEDTAPLGSFIEGIRLFAKENRKFSTSAIAVNLWTKKDAREASKSHWCDNCLYKNRCTKEHCVNEELVEKYSQSWKALRIPPADIAKVCEDIDHLIVFDCEMAEHYVMQFSGLEMLRTERGGYIFKRKKDILLQLPPKVHIIKRVQEMTHITEQLLARQGYSRFMAMEDEILPFLKAARYLTGYAIMNDLDALRMDLGDKVFYANPDTKIVDVQVLADMLYDSERNLSLENACDLAGLQNDDEGQYHNALYDARMTGKLLLKVMIPFIKKYRISPALPIYYIKSSVSNELTRMNPEFSTVSYGEAGYER